jgi:hypothetical protein
MQLRPLPPALTKTYPLTLLPSSATLLFNVCRCCYASLPLFLFFLSFHFAFLASAGSGPASLCCCFRKAAVPRHSWWSPCCLHQHDSQPH